VPGGTQVPGGRQTAFAYWTVTICGGLSHTLPLAVRFVTPICQALQPHKSKPLWFGLFPVRSPLLGEWSLFLWVLRCFSSPGSRSPAYVFSRGRAWFACAGFPIRRPPDRCLYTAPRGFSQCPASFIGVWRQGIHRKPLVAFFRDAESSTLFAAPVCAACLPACHAHAVFAWATRTLFVRLATCGHTCAPATPGRCLGLGACRHAPTPVCLRIFFLSLNAFCTCSVVKVLLVSQSGG
jgi:hypothetical protein